MCVLSLWWNFFVSHDKYIARPSSTLIHRQYNRDWGTSYSRPPIHPYLTPPLQNPGGATGVLHNFMSSPTQSLTSSGSLLGWNLRCSHSVSVLCLIWLPSMVVVYAACQHPGRRHTATDVALPRKIQNNSYRKFFRQVIVFKIFLSVFVVIACLMQQSFCFLFRWIWLTFDNSLLIRAAKLLPLSPRLR